MILVVEDEETIRDQLADALPLLGFDVSLASDGFDALNNLETVQPDLIMSDIVMPGMSGIDLKKELSKSDRLASIPFVFVSALSGMQHIREGMHLAADDYVTKPFRLNELKTVLEAQLEKARARERHHDRSLQELVESLQLIFPHEIITPITVIYGFADFLKTLDMQDPKDSKLAEEMLEGITSAATRLRSMTDRFTESVRNNLHKVQAGKDPLEESFAYDMAETIRTTAEQIAASKEARGRLDLRLENGLVVVQKEAVVRIIGEVLKNAFEFSPETEFVSVTGSVDGESYNVQIADNGPGMTQDQIARIGMFLQFGRKTREQQGLGIGLAVSKQLAEMIGCELHFSSHEGSGLEVRIRIPLDLEAKALLN